MQPPPPPLSIEHLKIMVDKADAIVVGSVKDIKKTDEIRNHQKGKRVDVTLEVKTLLKGKGIADTLHIREWFSENGIVETKLPKKGKLSEPKHSVKVVRMTAGPNAYHGQYRKGFNVIILLKKVGEPGIFKPLGAGTYDMYLCEFLIENNKIKPISYFSFAGDIKEYAGSERQFVNLIKTLLKKKKDLK